ncbi:MAG: branched-chain amino acid ABC transporter permease [Coriobacteriia bacterium]|nr:branched-chain amino acid ABC transporter permease [Coriobacteriia bacterium]
MGFPELLQFTFAGLKNGAVYALLALGFTIVYASTGVINFAQGEFYMLGGMLAAFLFAAYGLPLPFAAVGAVAVAAGVGVVFELLAIRPRKDGDPLALIIITVGGSILIKALSRHVFGPDEVSMPVFTRGASLEVAGARLELQTLWIWGLTATTVAALTFLYRRTAFGRAMRACAVNRRAARIVGVDTRTMVMASFGLAAALGALGGLAVTPLTQMRFDAGSSVALKGFAAAILGGLGSPVAAVVGGVVLGLLESMSIAFLSSTYKDAVALVVLLAVLFMRPQGLLGRARREKL